MGERISLHDCFVVYWWNYKILLDNASNMCDIIPHPACVSSGCTAVSIGKEDIVSNTIIMKLCKSFFLKKYN